MLQTIGNSKVLFYRISYLKPGGRYQNIAVRNNLDGTYTIITSTEASAPYAPLPRNQVNNLSSVSLNQANFVPLSNPEKSQSIVDLIATVQKKFFD